jgi:hypothetical protein
MGLFGFATVTLATMAVLAKAVGTDLAPFIAKMWVVYALYALGFRFEHVAAAVTAVLEAGDTVIRTVASLL